MSNPRTIPDGFISAGTHPDGTPLYIRRPKTPIADAVLGKAVEIEGDLHDEIIADLRALGWPYAHNRMDKKSTAGNGVTDFIIAGSRGRTFWIECKARGKKRSPDQQAFAAQLERFGHVPYLCKSIEEFREIVKP